MQGLQHKIDITFHSELWNFSEKFHPAAFSCFFQPDCAHTIISKSSLKLKKGLIELKSFQYKIQDELGIHARPAGLLVKTAGEFVSDITFEKEGKKASAKKLFAIMSMGVKKDDMITVTAEGADEGAAIAAVQKFLEEHL